MKLAAFSENQFVDAAGVGGLTAAFGQVSGAVVALGQAGFPTAGLVSPESMTVGLGAMTATIGLPSPWSVITSGGIVVRAHGAQTGQDTQTYAVNFASLVPATGSVTAYLAASIVTIQQNPFPLTGPPVGHPSYNPNFVPTVAYATNTYSVSLAAVTGQPNNSTTFELFRTTLTAGQVNLSVVSDAGWYRSPCYTALPATVFGTGGILTLAQAQAVVAPTTTGLSQTLPVVATAGGLSYKMVNPLSVGGWTIVAQSADRLVGATATPAASLAIPPGGALQVWGNAASGQWDITAANPLMMASIANVFTAAQTINAAGATAALIVSGGTANGTGIQIIGNGATTPNKYLRVANGVFGIVNSAYTVQILGLDDIGNLTVPGQVNGGSLGISGNATISGTLLAGGNTTVNSSLNVLGGINAGATGIGTTGAINAGAGISAAGIVQGASVQSSAGNVTAVNGRLIATFGAYQSGIPSAATLLSDFTLGQTAANYTRLPNGFMMQWWSQNLVNQSTNVINFPIAFPVACVGVFAQIGNLIPTTSLNFSVGVQAANTAQCVAVMASATPPGTSEGVWFLAIGF